MIALVLAATLATTVTLDARHAALRALIASAGDGCDAAHLTSAIAGATFQRLGTIEGDEVALASVEDPCLCGAQNCPYYVVRFGAVPKLLYATSGISAATKSGIPLPMLVVTAHDSALVMDVTTVAWRSGGYRQIASARVRGDTGAEKSDDLPIRFARGASSTVLRGSASEGWYDSYAFDATKGRHVLISGVHAGSPVRITVLTADGTTFAQVTPGRPYRLPASGAYHVQVEPDAEHDVPYSLTFAIR
jgi:hypothetical protein